MSKFEGDLAGSEVGASGQPGPDPGHFTISTTAYGHPSMTPDGSTAGVLHPADGPWPSLQHCSGIAPAAALVLSMACLKGPFTSPVNTAHTHSPPSYYADSSGLIYAPRQHIKLTFMLPLSVKAMSQTH